MSQTPSSSASESASIWSFLNFVFAFVFSAFVFFAVGSFVWFGMLNSIKLHGPAVATTAAAVAPVAAVPASAAALPVLEVTLKPDTANPMMYNTKEITAKAGQKIKLTFDNRGAIAPLPHNIVVGQAGTKDRILALSMQIMTDPNGMAKGYIPEAPEVLAHTKLVNAGQTETIEFTVAGAGDYPYMCTFPGHALMMNGVIKVQ